MFANNFFGGGGLSGGDLFSQTFSNFFQSGVEPFFRFQAADVGRRITNPVPVTRIETAARDRQAMRSGRMRTSRPARLVQDTSNEYDILPANHGFRRGRGPDNAPVRYNRNRNQWFDTNTHHANAPEPIVIPPSYMTLEEINNIPTYTFKTKKKQSKVITQFNHYIETQSNTDQTADESELGASAAPCGTNSNQNESNETADCEECALECDICLSEFRPGNSIKPLACGHEFHSICLDEWLRKIANCPKCRLGVKAGFRKLERQKRKTQILAARERIRQRNEELAGSIGIDQNNAARSYSMPSRITLRRGSSQTTNQNQKKPDSLHKSSTTTQKGDNQETPNSSSQNQTSLKQSVSKPETNHRKKSTSSSNSMPSSSSSDHQATEKKRPSKNGSQTFPKPCKGVPAKGKSSSGQSSIVTDRTKLNLDNRRSSSASDRSQLQGDNSSQKEKQVEIPPVLSVEARRRAADAAIKRQEMFLNTLNDVPEE